MNKVRLFLISHSNLVQFIKFCAVGVSNMVVNYFIYYVIVFLNRDAYLLANVLGWIVSVFNSFIWNNKFVFQNKGSKQNIGYRLLKTYGAYGITLLLSSALLVVQVEYLGVSEFIAPIINLFVTTPINFMLNKFWAFRKK